MMGLDLIKAFELKSEYICPNCAELDKPCLRNVDIYELTVGYGFFEHLENCDSCGDYYSIKIHTKERLVEVSKAE